MFGTSVPLSATLTEVGDEIGRIAFAQAQARHTHMRVCLTQFLGNRITRGSDLFGRSDVAREPLCAAPCRYAIEIRSNFPALTYGVASGAGFRKKRLPRPVRVRY